MKKKMVSKICTAGLLVAMLSSSAVFAEPILTPNGPWLQDNQNVSFSSFLTNQQLYDKLAQIEASSHGKMTLEIAGYSNAPYNDLKKSVGYPLYVAKFGKEDEGKKKVLITSQIHGNETLTTEAVIELMQKLAAGGKDVDEMLDKVTVWFMPRINPDGSENKLPSGEIYPTRYSLQPWVPNTLGLADGTLAPWYYNADGSERDINDDGRVVYGVPGFDQNRDYNPNLNFKPEEFDKAKLEAFLNNKALNNSKNGGIFTTPEARIVTSVWQQLRPDVYFDLHHRGFNALTDEDTRSVSIQVAAEVAVPYTDALTGEYHAVDPLAQELSKKVNALGYLSLQRGFSSFGAIQKYPRVNLPGTSLGTFAFNGSAIMLIELKGQSQSLGQKANGMLKQTVKEPVYEILKALGDGSINNVDTKIYDNIPEGANRVSPNPKEDDLF